MIPLLDGNFSVAGVLERGMKRRHSRLIAALTSSEADPSSSKRQRKSRRAKVSPQRVHAFVDSLVGDHLHAKRVVSLSSGVVGVVHAAALGVHAIGMGLADAVGLEGKHAVKQIDRLLSNQGIDVWEEFAAWVPFVIGPRERVLVAMDWTDFDKDDQTTLAMHLVTTHGRATPLLWMTVRKSELAEQRNAHEDKLLRRLAEVVPSTVEVIVLADRAFGDQARYEFIEELGLKFIIRFRECIVVTMPGAEPRPAADLVPTNGRAVLHRAVEVTRGRTPVPGVALVKAKAMKEAWCLATNCSDMTAKELVGAYARRFTIEETFRDTKDPRFGFGLSASRISTPQRRDRVFFLSAIASVLMTLLGAAGEALGIDKYLKVNTSKKRQHSLLRQGLMWYNAIPMMEASRLRRLMTKFGEMIHDHAVCRRVCGVI
jgi:hypothetical protein